MATLRANVVSAALKRNGVTSLPSGTHASFKGVRVSQALDEVCVWADYATPGRGARAASSIAELLTEIGFTVRPNVADPTFLYVSKES